jgi:hypothetical protein
MAKKDKYAPRETLPRFYKADFELQKKIGTGTLDFATVAKMQAYLDALTTDVTPELRGHMDEILKILSEIQAMEYNREEFLPQITRALMNMKAISGMFHHMAVCRISAFLLTFLEDVRKFDNDVFEIVTAFTTVTKTLLDMNIRQETNPLGQTFLTEIRSACKRYYDKQAAAIKG